MGCPLPTLLLKDTFVPGAVFLFPSGWSFGRVHPRRKRAANIDLGRVFAAHTRAPPH